MTEFWVTLVFDQGDGAIVPYAVRFDAPDAEAASEAAQHEGPKMSWRGEFLGVRDVIRGHLADLDVRSPMRPGAATLDVAAAVLDLPGLDGVAWGDLHHTFGPATDLPGWLSGLTSGAQDVRVRSLDAVFGLLDHQGESGCVMAAAIPFLVTVLERWPRDLPERDQLARYLAYEANSAGDVRRDVIERKWALRQRWLLSGDTVAERVEREVRNRRAVAHAFRREGGRLRALAGEGDPGVAAAITAILRAVDPR